MNRQTVLGTSHRVQKQRPTAPREGSASAAARSLVSSWMAEFPRRKAGEPSGGSNNKRAGIDSDADVTATGTAGSEQPPSPPRDIPQAMAHVRDTMFSPLPERGLSAALTATVLTRRASIPPMVSTSHLQAVLDWTPTMAPEDMLRQRWDGGVGGGGGVRQARGGVRFGVIPGRTRRWKEFSGLRFDWILAEAVGSGLVEVFETGCVGRGVRLVSPS
ncbi:hypothetical protein MAPG_03260 [Magnaporthiopsis poae ATCC 64411]|uniref:Uncharacterized protein n=1 Tax=Magnaporthiopsis poae (strain ATCC 64411 / 73-15) TaxID=644358 RepID=A0A0C4DTJ2_MAGP6|nr:hypothetical protein MAPG_03260 [Magnaporthiopsis poae ATCC 64411]